MELNNPKIKTEFIRPDKLKKLLNEMQESLFARHINGLNSLRILNCLSKNKRNVFGYDLDAKKYEKDTKSFYRRKRLRHKLKRIIKELKFAKKNLKNYQSLTLREKEVIRLLAKGYNNPEIAQQLFISRSTVEQHRKNINRKLNIKSFMDLMRYAYAYNLV